MKPRILEGTAIDRRHVTTLEEFSALLAAPDTVVIVAGHAVIPAQLPRASYLAQPKPRRPGRGKNARALFEWLNANPTTTFAAIQTAPSPTAPPRRQPATLTPTTSAPPAHKARDKEAEYLAKRYRAMVAKYPAARNISRKEFLAWAKGQGGPSFRKLYAAYIASGYESGLTPTVNLKDTSRNFQVDNLGWFTRDALRKREWWLLNYKHAEQQSKGYLTGGAVIR